MKRVQTSEERGFTLIEVLVALAVTLIVMSAVFLLLQKGQGSFRREPQVTDMTASARTGIDRISQDLTIAGFETPPNTSIMWFNGPTPVAPDELTIVYSDPEVPWCKPKGCTSTGGGKGGKGGPGGGGGPCNTIGTSSVVNIDPYSFQYQPGNYEQVYQDGQILMALQGPNGDPACDNMAPGIFPFELTQDPKCTGAGGAGSGPAGCATLNLNHNPSGSTAINVPGGFQNDVSVNCAIIGWFHVVQYRVNPLPPTPNPMLERRDIVLGEPWTPVSNNVENLQVQYAQGLNPAFFDVPPLIPIGGDPNTWITQVRVTVTGRTESTNLEGGTQGVFASGDTHIRRSFTTTMSLRNQLGNAAQKGLVWN